MEDTWRLVGLLMFTVKIEPPVEVPTDMLRVMIVDETMVHGRDCCAEELMLMTFAVQL